MQIEALKANVNKKDINKTLKGVLLNNYIKNQEKVNFEEMKDTLLVVDSKDDTKISKNINTNESSFDTTKAIKPLLAGTMVLVGSVFALSAIAKKSSNNILKSKSFEQLPDLAINMNIKEESQFAIYRAIRDPNFKNMMGAAAVFLMSGITLGCKNFVDGAKEIWVKKQEADIEKNLQEKLIDVETASFSGKLKFVNDLTSKNIKYFDEILNKKQEDKTPSIFKGFPSFKSSQQEDKKTKLSKDAKYLLMTAGVLAGAILLGKFSISNLKKTAQNTQKYANGYTEKTIDAINELSKKTNKDDVPRLIELFKSICAKPDFIKETAKKYGLGDNEIQKIIEEVNATKKTIFSDAPTALGGIPKKIQYYCYIDENKGHLYNWILNPENKFTKYIFGAFTLSSATGYMFKQSMDAVKEVAVLKENAKTELALRKKLVDVEIANFKSKKESAINPLVENFTKQVNSGTKSKEELKQLADNILLETKNGPPYVYA